jgi:hypothetical protein
VLIPFAAEYVRKYRYMGRMPGWVSHTFGHFFGDSCGGILVFGSPAGRYTATFPDRRVIQLRRGFNFPGTPHNSASFFISRALAWLRKNTDFDVVVAFSNPRDAEIGTVYQASNWIYLGVITSGSSFIVDGVRVHERVLQARHGTRAPASLREIYGDRLVVYPGSHKHRYAYSLRKDLIIPRLLPYPKRETVVTTAKEAERMIPAALGLGEIPLESCPNWRCIRHTQNHQCL